MPPLSNDPEQTADALSNELLILIESTAGEFVDPAKRIACGVRLYLHAAREYPAFAQAVAATGLHVAGLNSLLHEFLPRHLYSGESTARFADMSSQAAVDLIAGATLAAVARIASGQAPPDHPEQVAAAILRGLGVRGAEARRLVKIPLPAIRPAPGSRLAGARGT